MKNIIVTTVFLVILISNAFAQEIDCDVVLNLEMLTTSEARDNLTDFVQQVKHYINTYRWTNENYGNEKIKCSFNISIHGSTGENHYIAEVYIGSQRPIYKSARNTAVVRLKDDAWEFDYTRNQSLTHSETRFDPLLSFLDFYAYLILGYDADTYKPSGGNPYFQKATDIANLARGASAQQKGWEQTQQSKYSRGQLVEELLNPKFQDFRRAVHTYHYRGIDSLYTNSVKPLKKILAALRSIGNLSEKINQPSLIIRTFFDTKYLEIADTFLLNKDRDIFNRLSKIDPAHQKTYDEYRDKPQQ